MGFGKFFNLKKNVSPLTRFKVLQVLTRLKKSFVYEIYLNEETDEVLSIHLLIRPIYQN